MQKAGALICMSINKAQVSKKLAHLIPCLIFLSNVETLHATSFLDKTIKG